MNIFSIRRFRQMVVLVALLCSTSVWAATFTVNNTGRNVDSNPGDGVCSGGGGCSLYAAIQETNALAGADTIEFAAGVTGTILGIYSITDDLTITGPGADSLTVDGNNWGTVFTINMHGITKTVNISGLTVTNGSGTITYKSSKGGGFYVGMLQILNIDSCVISNNTAPSDVNNPVSSGGGIYIYWGTVTLTDTTVANNTVTSSDFYSGGGGIYNNNGSLTIIDSFIVDNTTTTGRAGGIYNETSADNVTVISGTTISGNTTGMGGGIFNREGTLTLTDATISGNTGYSSGGGIYNSATMTLTDSSVSGNTTFDRGGGIGNIGTLNVNNSTISGNTSQRNGGGIDNNIDTLNVNNSTISGNTSWRNGGGIDNGGTLNVNNSTISGNTGRQGGGGIYDSGSTSLNYATITNNTTDTGSGGGIRTYFSTLNIRNSIIAGNTDGSGNDYPDCDGEIVSGGYNLIGDTTGCTITGDIITGNPLLDILADNSGPTQTHALQAGSPAIDAGNPVCTWDDDNDSGTPEVALTRDQRDFFRPIDGDDDLTPTCDIGAYEFDPSPDIDVTDSLGSADDLQIPFFGDVTVGTSLSAETVTIANIGSSRLTVSDIQITGPSASDFSLDLSGGPAPCGAPAVVILAGDSCTVAVTFSPLSAGVKSASLDMTSDDPDTGTVNVGLSGTGVAPDISIDPTSHDFGSLNVGWSRGSGFTISNSGTGTLLVGSIGVTGGDLAEFSVDSYACGSLTPTIRPGSSCTVQVIFLPTSAGLKTTTLRITSNDPDTPNLDVLLSGTGTVPDISVDPASHDFGSVAVGYSSVAPRFTISNSGTATLYTNIELIDDDFAEFSVTAGSCFNFPLPQIPAGQSCNFWATFSPSSTGAKITTLRISSNDPDTPNLDLPLSGTGIPAVPDISVGPTSYDFGLVDVGSSSPARSFRIYNFGTGDLLVNSIGLRDGDVGMFSIAAGTCASLTPTIAPTWSCTVEVTFSPASEGAKTTILRIASNDPDTPNLDVQLSGAAPAPDIAISPTSQDFGSVLVGGFSFRTFTIYNLGTLDLVVGSIGVTGDDAAEFSIFADTCPGLTPTIIPGSSCTVQARFLPTSTGAKTATLNITSNDPDTPNLDVSLSGNGILGVPDISVRPISHDFGLVDVGSSSPAWGFIIDNWGTGDLLVSSIEVINGDAGMFSVTVSGLCTTIPPYDDWVVSCFVRVIFSPTSAGVKATTLRIISNDPDTPTLDVPFSGTGNGPDISVSPISHDFSLVDVGSSSVAQAFTVSNTGTAALTISSISLTGVDSSEFNITNNTCLTSVAPGNTCSFNADFTPTSTVVKSADVSIASDAPGSPTTLPLSGTGTAPAIPAIERNALIDLYNSTNGADWTDNTNWLGPEGTECTWFGVTCNSNETAVTGIGLSNNNLSGTLPVELGNFTNLTSLSLSRNRLSGSIPVSLGDITSLTYLVLWDNQLSGPIPASLGDLTSLTYLILWGNQLSGSIPPELGDLANLISLDLHSNQLSGEIPASLGGLISLNFLNLRSNQLSGSIPDLSNLNLLNDRSDFRWNAIYTDDDALRTFLNSKQTGGDWESTQTIAPSNLTTGVITPTSVELTWSAIAYTGGAGGYEVYYSTTPGGPYTLFETTADKTVTSSTITGLTPGTTYYFVVLTVTNSHLNNQNTIYTEYTPEISATTDELNVAPTSDPNGPYTGTEGQAITLDGSGSGDPDGSITFYEWDIDNDGTYEYSSSSATQSHTYAQQGTYTIRLRVTDDLGATGEATTTAAISDTSPTADFTGAPTSGTAPHTVNFTNNSTGYDQPLSYAWDFDNDGTVDSSAQSPSRTYADAGTYTVKLTVTDADGSPDTMTRTGYVVVDVPVYTLTVNVTGTGGGSVTSNDGAINCGSTCTHDYADGAIVTLAANADPGSIFGGWSGDCTGANVTAQVTMDAGMSCTATFTPVIPAAERNALIDLYDSTNGGGWTDSTNWLGSEGSECAWFGVTCDAGGYNVFSISLSNNNLSGIIPASIGDLSALGYLDLSENQLTGSIPVEVGALSNLLELYLSSNRLAGTVPATLGDLASLKTLYISSNQLAGEIPAVITDLASLIDNQSDFRWNALYTYSVDLQNFLNSRQIDGDWESTQTIAPANFNVNVVTSTSVTLMWDAIAYTGDAGGYEVYYATAPGGPYALFETTADKTVTSSTVTGLDPYAAYYFAVRAMTDMHADNQNVLYSEYTYEISNTSTHPYDTNQDWVIGDFELLDAIDDWAEGNLGDFELLDLIDYWAAGCYHWDASSGSHKPGC